MKLTKQADIVRPMRNAIYKHNALLAIALSFLLIVSSSLQVVHDQLVDHQHNSDCAMYVLDGNGAAASEQTVCAVKKQSIAINSLLPVFWVLSQVSPALARAPPVTS